MECLFQTENCFFNSVGISSVSIIPDVQMTASTESSGYPAYHGRLNDKRSDGWCAAESSRNNDWIQVDFGKTYVLCGIASQGDVNGNERVTDFKLSYSSEGSFWRWYTHTNGTKVVSCYFKLTKCACRK